MGFSITGVTLVNLKSCRLLLLLFPVPRLQRPLQRVVYRRQLQLHREPLRICDNAARPADVPQLRS